MRALLAEHVPDHGVFGEEHGAVRTDTDYVWVLDPIGVPRPSPGCRSRHACGAAPSRQPRAGIIDQPILQSAGWA
jgi:hypothetical protein